MRSEFDETYKKIEFIRILHLSDFHFPDVKFEDNRSVDKESGLQSPQISVLNEVYKIIDDVDFILISGDFTTSRNNEKFDNIEEFGKCLSFVCEKFSHHRAKIYSVFGNHDLERGCGSRKFDRFLHKAQEYPVIDFGGPEICEQRKLIKSKSSKLELDLLLTNTCKNSSDKPYNPEKLKSYIKEPISSIYGEDIYKASEVIQLTLT